MGTKHIASASARRFALGFALDCSFSFNQSRISGALMTQDTHTEFSVVELIKRLSLEERAGVSLLDVEDTEAELRGRRVGRAVL